MVVRILLVEDKPISAAAVRQQCGLFREAGAASAVGLPGTSRQQDRTHKISVINPLVRCVKSRCNVILEPTRKRLASEPAYALARMLSMAELGFKVVPNLLWDEGFEVGTP